MYVQQIDHLHVNTDDARRYVEVSYGEAYTYDARGLLKSLEHGEYSGDGIGNVYTVQEDETLTLAKITLVRSPFDQDDYADVSVTVDGVFIGSYRIDGRS